MTLDESLGHSVGDDPREQTYRADGVVVTRNRVGELVGVAVGVEDADNRDAQLLGLIDSEVLLLGVNNPERARRLLQVADTAEALVKLVELALLDEQLFLGEAGLRGVLVVELLELLHAREALTDRVEVGQQTTQPTLVDVGLAHAHRLLGDGLLSLLLGAHKEHRSAAGDGLLDEVVSLVDVRQRLLKVDDVNARALGKDKTLDLRVPPTCLVSEVNAAVEQLANGYDGHEPFSCSQRRRDRGQARALLAVCRRSRRDLP